MANDYKAALKRFEDAVRADAFKGCRHPADVPGIEREYEQAKAVLVRKLQYRKLAAQERANRVIFD